MMPTEAAGPSAAAASPSAAPVSELPPHLAALLDAHPSLVIHSGSSALFESSRRLFNRAVATKPLAIVRPGSEAEVEAVVSACAGRGRRRGRQDPARDPRRGPRLPRPVARRRGRGGGHARSRGGGRRGGRHDGARGRRGVVRRAPGGARGARAHGADGVGATRSATPAGPRAPATASCRGTYGLGVDQIVGARVATPDRGVVDTDDDAELLWALRGAGTGGLGAVVELRVRAYPQPTMLAGMLAFPLEEGEDVFAGLAALGRDGAAVPDALSRDFMLVRLPGGVAAVVVLFAWVQPRDDDDLTAARACLDRMRRLGTVLMDTVGESECPPASQPAPPFLPFPSSQPAFSPSQLASVCVYF